MTWQPIETCPAAIGVRLLLVNGRCYIGAREHGRWFICRPTDGLKGYTADNRAYGRIAPTHWAPLPKFEAKP